MLVVTKPSGPNAQLHRRGVWVPAFAGTTFRKSKPRALRSLSRPPVVDPVLPRQHVLCADRLDDEVARESHYAREVIDMARAPRGALNALHPRAAQPSIAFQRGRNACGVFPGLAEAIGEHRGVLDRHACA